MVVVIVIEGNIGAGKTTFCQRFQSYLRDEHKLKVVMCIEPVDTWLADGSLARYYADPARYAFETQCHFFATRVDEQRATWAEHGGATADVILCERSLISDRMFWRAACKQHGLSELTDATYTNMWKKWQELTPMPAPTLVVYLKTCVETTMARIRVRHRDAEEEGITRAYQQELHDQHECTLLPHVTLPQGQHVPTLTLDGNSAFKHDDAVFKAMADKIMAAAL